MSAAPWRIGLRWALQPARWRSGRFAVELVATTLAGIGMTAAVALAAGIPDYGYSRHLLQQIIALLLLGSPGLLMATSVARLASGTRDRRYAALRLLGVPAASTRLFAISETAVPVLKASSSEWPCTRSASRCSAGSSCRPRGQQAWSWPPVWERC